MNTHKSIFHLNKYQYTYNKNKNIKIAYNYLYFINNVYNINNT